MKPDFLKKYRTVLTLLPVLAVFALICFFSSRTADQSNRESNRIVDILFRIVFPNAKNLPKELYRSLYHGTVVVVRKTAHMVEFGLLGFFLYPFADACLKACRVARIGRLKHPVPLTAFAAGVLAASFDECHQIFVEGRGPQVTDVLIDSVGVLLGILAMYGVRRLYAVYAARRKPSENGGGSRP